MSAGFLDAFWEKKNYGEMIKVNKGSFFSISKLHLFYYFNKLFVMLWLCLLTTVVLWLSLIYKPTRCFLLEVSVNLVYQLAEKGSPTKKFSDGVKALLAHLWRKRKEQLHFCSHSEASSGSDQGACSCAEKQTSVCGDSSAQAACTSP